MDPRVIYITGLSTQVTFAGAPAQLRLVLHIKWCEAGLLTRMKYLANFWLKNASFAQEQHIGYISGYRVSKPSLHRQHVDSRAWVREWWDNDVMNKSGCDSMAKTLRALYQQTEEDQVVPNAADVTSAEHRRQLSDQGNEIVYISNIQISPAVSLFPPLRPFVAPCPITFFFGKLSSHTDIVTKQFASKGLGRPALDLYYRLLLGNTLPVWYGFNGPVTFILMPGLIMDDEVTAMWRDKLPDVNYDDSTSSGGDDLVEAVTEYLVEWYKRAGYEMFLRRAFVNDGSEVPAVVAAIMGRQMDLIRPAAGATTGPDNSDDDDDAGELPTPPKQQNTSPSIRSGREDTTSGSGGSGGNGGGSSGTRPSPGSNTSGQGRPQQPQSSPSPRPASEQVQPSPANYRKKTPPAPVPAAQQQQLLPGEGSSSDPPEESTALGDSTLFGDRALYGSNKPSSPPAPPSSPPQAQFDDSTAYPEEPTNTNNDTTSFAAQDDTQKLGPYGETTIYDDNAEAGPSDPQRIRPSPAEAAAQRLAGEDLELQEAIAASFFSAQSTLPSEAPENDTSMATAERSSDSEGQSFYQELQLGFQNNLAELNMTADDIALAQAAGQRVVLSSDEVEPQQTVETAGADEDEEMSDVQAQTQAQTQPPPPQQQQQPVGAAVEISTEAFLDETEGFIAPDSRVRE